jgi:hypothetical protein
MPRSSKWSVPCRFAEWKFVCISCLWCVLHATHTFHPPWIAYPNNTWWSFNYKAPNFATFSSLLLLSTSLVWIFVSAPYSQTPSVYIYEEDQVFLGMKKLFSFQVNTVTSLYPNPSVVFHTIMSPSTQKLAFYTTPETVQGTIRTTVSGS